MVISQRELHLIVIFDGLFCTLKGEYQRNLIKKISCDVIRRYRKRLGVSVDEIARLMNVDRATAYRWEAGTREPTIHNLMRLAECFGVTETELLHPREENEDSKNVL